jgi:protein-L-isoaspartate(D-aspartate) O-methyltransferase
MSLIDNLIQQGWLKTKKIIQAFKEIDRKDFLPGEMKDLAEINTALSIGYDQTISQPLVVAFMLELLNPSPGEKILDIGAGSGWTTALLAHIVSQKGNPKSKIQNPKPESEGKVIALEIVPELAEFGKKNVSKYNFIEEGIVEFICADATKGWLKEAPYDKILASATAEEIPQAWKKQLKIGGCIVAPMGTSICLFRKKTESDFEKIKYPGFIFVPLVEKK